MGRYLWGCSFVEWSIVHSKHMTGYEIAIQLSGNQEEMAKCNRQFEISLAQLCDGEALDIVRNTPKGEGY